MFFKLIKSLVQIKRLVRLILQKKNIPCFRKEKIIIIIITLIFAHDNSHLINDRIFLNEWPKPIFVIHTGLMSF
jgi:hypothetical protein